MKMERTRTLIVVIVVLLIAAVALYLLPSDQPTYQGKTVQVWFKEYANVIQSGQFISGYSSSGRILLDAQTRKQLPDPAWDAFRALDSNAVPYLISVLRVSPFEAPAFVRVYTNLPLAIRNRIPNPWLERSYRYAALQILAGLGESARPAHPMMVKLVTQPDPFLRIGALTALVHADQTLVESAVLELGSGQNYADALFLAEVRQSKSVRVTQLVVKILESPDPELRRRAIMLLEKQGSLAGPAAVGILGAMQDSHPDVRYYAARSLEAISEGASPELRAQIMEAMQAGLNDENAMVSNVARRTLSKLAPSKDLTPSSN